MSKQIWLSPVLGNSRERLVEHSADFIKRGETNRFLYIAASHSLLELVTKWILDFDSIRGIWGTLPVFLFRGLVRHIITTALAGETGSTLPKRTPIDVEESYLKKSLLSQIMRSLVGLGELKALAPLAHRDGTVNTIVTLIGELQRAAKRPEEFHSIIETRASDLIALQNESPDGTQPNVRSLPRQLDFDREIVKIYEAYARALDQFQLTEVDADQLRALQVLRGEVDSTEVALPWLDKVELLILDGFFDFTPVQGEILRTLIPRVPHVIVNLYWDEENAEVFRPFAETLEQLRSMSEDFEVIRQANSRDVGESTTAIRTRLFNPEFLPELGNEGDDVTEVAQSSADETSDVENQGGLDARGTRAPRVFRCRDRETEVREIAKEIKRLVLLENFSIRDVALVVRERASYAETIARVFADEKIPCTVERVINLAEIPAVRAVLKLFQILADERGAQDPRVTDLADLIKSGYFRLSDESIRHLRESPAFGQEALLDFASLEDRGFGSWNPDELENVFAYVGSDLRLERWLERARQLASNDPVATEIRSQIFGEDTGDSEDIEESHDAEDEPVTSKTSGPSSAPTREIHPTILQWAALLLQEFATAIRLTPREDQASKLRVGLLKLLDDLQFAGTIRESLTDLSLESALPRATLDLRALEGIRQATVDAIKSIEIATKVTKGDDAGSIVSLADFIAEIERCIAAHSLSITSADRDGVQVLEATDVRGLQFRAIFIAGLIEGGFPLRKPRDWIYPHEERERLKEYGLTLEDISPSTLLKEEHYFYQAACRATERLYLTWPLVIEGGAETVVSYYIDELRHALAPVELMNEDKRLDFDGDAVFDSSSPGELATSLVRLKERHRHRGRSMIPFAVSDVDRMLEWAKERAVVTPSALARIAIGHERVGEHFGRYDGRIMNDDLRAMLAERYGTDYVWSASALSLFGRSPFKFFAERVLKLEPRIEAALDLAAMDAGGLMHEALRRFFAKNRGKRLARTDRIRLRNEMRSIADRVFSERERAVPPLNNHVWKIDREIRQLQLAQVVDFEIDLQSKDEADGVLPTYFELGFGMQHGTRDERSTPDFLCMSRDEDAPPATETIRLRGQIDRVDVAQDGTLVAYDYKLSQGASEKDMLEGRDLQIGIYLDAIEKLFFPGHEIAGGGYYVLRGCDRKRGLYRRAFEKYTHLGGRAGSIVDDEKWFAHRTTMRKSIWRFITAIRAGEFFVNPTAPIQTCSNCGFSAVCRYDKYRIMRKFAVR